MRTSSILVLAGATLVTLATAPIAAHHAFGGEFDSTRPVLIWSTEAIRLFLVVEALGFGDVHLGISGAFFVALTGSLLTAVPLTPAGIGVVEAGVVGVLTIVYSIGQTEALAITLVDRAISVLSIIIFGSIAYWLSPKRRGLGVDETARTSSTASPA